MRLNSVMTFAVAGILGIVAVGATRTYLEHERARMFGEMQNARPQQTLVVASKPMPYGAALDRSSLKEIPWASDVVPEGAYRHVDDVLVDERKRYLLSSVAPNTPVLEGQITAPGEKPTLSTALGEGKRAFTIRVNDVLGVAGFVLPGDLVDVMLTRLQGGEPYVDVLLQGLRVLAIDQFANEQTDEPNVSKSVTFEVDPEQAQKLALGAQLGTLSLALRNSSNAMQEASRRITPDDLAPPEVSPAPKADEEGEAAPPAVAPERRNCDVRVHRGMDSTKYRLPC